MAIYKKCGLCPQRDKGVVYYPTECTDSSGGDECGGGDGRVAVGKCVGVVLSFALYRDGADGRRDEYSGGVIGRPYYERAG